jgi:hypothetical protein
MELDIVVTVHLNPEHDLFVDEKERPELPYWKCRKWAMYIVVRVLNI